MKRKAKGKCKVVTVNGTKRRICRTAKGKIKSNTALSGLGKAKRHQSRRRK